MKSWPEGLQPLGTRMVSDHPLKRALSTYQRDYEYGVLIQQYAVLLRHNRHTKFCHLTPGR